MTSPHQRIKSSRERTFEKGPGRKERLVKRNREYLLGLDKTSFTEASKRLVTQ